MDEKQSRYAISQAVRRHAKEIGDDVVFTFAEKEIRYAEFDAATNQLANALLDAGIKPGDRIAFLGKNSPVYFELILAAAKIQAVVTPMNWRLAGPELEYIINDCGAKLIFLASEFHAQIAKILASLNKQPRLFLIDADDTNAHSYATWRDQFSDVDPKLDESPDHDLLQLYTSGTTGLPKGAVLTSRMILASRGQEEHGVVETWQIYARKETGLLVMPTFHVGGTVFGVSIMHSGAHILVLPEYDPNEVVEFLGKYTVGKIFMVPATLQMLLSHPEIDKVDFSSLSYIFYGASPIPQTLMLQAIEKIGCEFVQMYGATETGGTIVALSPDDHDPESDDPLVLKRMRSVGKPIWGVELKVIDEQGNTLAANEIGEIATRSMKNIKRYWNLPEATEKTIDKDGWLRTGDAGYLDEDGYLYIHDRVKDMVISGGENIYPAEVESAIYSHEKIADVAVIGVPDEKWGEAVKAIVVAKEGVEISEAEVIDYAKSRIASFKTPKSVDFMDALPRNATGKILKTELRKPYWKGKQRAVN